MNKKIKNATQSKVGDLVFKSKSEAMVYKTLLEHGFTPKYEPTKYIIWEGGEPKVPFFNRDSKTGLLKRDTKPLQPITYTPDFEFDYDGIKFIIEVKGMENDLFPVKKKMFRKHLETLNEPVVYFEIYSKRQLLQAIELVKVMKIINQIRQYFIYLPVKDRKIAENLLDGRKFAELKELVDSDVVKITEKRYKISLNDGSGLTEEEIVKLAEKAAEIEEQYNNLKELQEIVNEQADPFIEDESMYDPPLTDLEDYYA